MSPADDLLYSTLFRLAQKLGEPSGLFTRVQPFEFLSEGSYTLVEYVSREMEAR